MSTQRQISMKTRFLVAGAVLAMFAFAPYASATVTRIHFSGAVGSGYADLTLGPAGAGDVVDSSHVPLAITEASGLFNGVKITGVLDLTHTAPPPGESLIPASYSLFSIPGHGHHNGVSYDNLFYPSGSPMICYIDADGKGNPGFVWPFSGGMFDLLGVMFTLDDGTFLDLWSFGVVDPAAEELPPFVSGLTYGLKLIQPIAGGGYEVLPGSPPGPFATATVPEPDFLWLFGAALVGLFAWRRTKESKRP